MSIRDIFSRKQIPDANYYVLCNDQFFSHWFGDSRVNTVILPCKTISQVYSVMNYVKSRRDQKRIRYVINKPRLREGIRYSLLTEENASAWYGKE
jgi:hypothetical protein